MHETLIYPLLVDEGVDAAAPCLDASESENFVVSLEYHFFHLFFLSFNEEYAVCAALSILFLLITE